MYVKLQVVYSFLRDLLKLLKRYILVQESNATKGKQALYAPLNLFLIQVRINMRMFS